MMGKAEILGCLAAVVAFLFCSQARSQVAPFPCDEILEWKGHRHGTLGPTGDRLFTERITPAPGFRGVFSYCHATPEFRDPLILTFYEAGGHRPLEDEEFIWRPTHLEARWKGPGFRVVERKFITEDDMMIDRVSVRSTADKPIDLEIYLTGSMTPLKDRFQSRKIMVDLSKWGNLSLGGQGSLDGTLPESIRIDPGTLEYDGMAYSLPDPDAGSRCNVVALQGGTERDPAFRLPRSVTLDLPDVHPAVHTLHLLVMTPALGERPVRPTPAYFLFRFDDGSEERVPWPSVSSRIKPPGEEGNVGQAALPVPAATPALGERASWRFLPLQDLSEPLMQLAYVPPPGRFVNQVVILKGEGGEVPVLLAASIEIPPATGRLPVLLGRRVFHGLSVHLVLAGEGFSPATTPWGSRGLYQSLHLEPGCQTVFNVLFAAGWRRLETVYGAMRRTGDGEILDEHRNTSSRWYRENVPRFSCSNPLMEKAWNYRWFLVRHAMMRIGLPNFSLPVFYAAKHGAAHTRVTTASTPHILMETRWLKDRTFAQGQMRALLMHQDEEGLLHNLSISAPGEIGMHWIPAAALEAYAVNGSLQYLREVCPLLARNLDGTFKRFDGDGDFLPAAADSAMTGLEGQPAFFYFGAGRVKGPDDALERPDFAAYVFASARALSDGLRVLGDAKEADRFQSMAERIRQAVLSKLWYRRDRFFCTVRASDHAPVPWKEAAGFYPFFAGLVPAQSPQEAGLTGLTDPALFWTPFPLATAARSVPGFSPDPRSEADPALLHGIGSTWPFANSIIAEVLAKACRDYTGSNLGEADYARFLEAYTLLHFEEGDPGRPILRGCYDGTTGQGFGPSDPFQSTYNDLLIRHVGGLEPRMEEGVTLHPLVKGLEHFSFQGIPYRGRMLDITWDRPDGKRVYPHAPEGFTLAVDGKEAFNVPDLRRMVMD